MKAGKIILLRALFYLIAASYELRATSFSYALQRLEARNSRLEAKKKHILALIKSISGIRGTIGGTAGDNLTPQDIVAFTAAFGAWLLQKGGAPKIVIGRDGRVSGPMVGALVTQTLIALGIDVVDLGISTTPTVEMAVPWEQAGAGIIITASHNPAHWNALKFINEAGEFISQKDGEALLALLDEGKIRYAEYKWLGACRSDLGEAYMNRHVESIVHLPMVTADAIRERVFHVVVDAVNSSGAVILPKLLRELGCVVTVINGEVSGEFAHNPEPLPEHLTQLSETVRTLGADVGFAVDPDVDRLAIVCEDGSMFGEEYTLVAVADYVLSQRPGNTVSNLSSTRALRDVTLRHGGQYFAAAVGEVNVVETMKAVGAVIGGEGNGGVILPELHYGRDALAGIALFLSLLLQSGGTVSQLRRRYPDYHIIKDRIDLTPETDMEKLLAALHERFKNEQCNTSDGLKIDFPDGWVHLRRSNTEPIIRIYAESDTEEKAKALANMMKQAIG
jgi:phosphomannomutase